MKTVQQLCDFIWSLEEEFSLLDMEIDGVKLWLISRVNIYYMLAEKSGLLSKPHNKISTNRKLFEGLNNLPNAFKSFLSIETGLDAVIIEHPRGVLLDDGRVVDIYTNHLRDDFEKHGLAYQTIEPAYMGRHIKTKHSKTLYIDGLSLLSKIISCGTRTKQKSNLKHVTDELSTKTKDCTGININYHKIFERELKKFNSRYITARWFFLKSKPRKLYLTVGYGYFHFVKAAKDLGIEVIELQHGTFSKYHLGYSYPISKPDTAYLPDQFYVWSDFWKNCNVLPIPEDRIKVYSFRHGMEKLQKYGKVEKKKQITIISQGVIGKDLAKKVPQILKEYPGYKVNFKLHPGEFGRWKEYPRLNELVKLQKVTVLEDVDLYKLLAESEYQAGVFSTAIFEGIDLGCKTILFSLPGIEYMDELIDAGKVDVIYK